MNNRIILPMENMSALTYFFIRDSGRNIKLELHHILYIESRRNYTRLVTTEKSYMLLLTLKDWITYLPPESFCQIHRGYIVSIPQLRSFDSNFACVSGAQLPIGKQFRDALPRKVIILGAETRGKLISKKINVLAYVP